MYTENFYGHLKSKIYSEIPHEQAKYIEDITRWRKDMNFMFEWQELYLTSERSERVRLFLPREHKIYTFEVTCNVLFSRHLKIPGRDELGRQPEVNLLNRACARELSTNLCRPRLVEDVISPD